MARRHREERVTLRGNGALNTDRGVSLERQGAALLGVGVDGEFGGGEFRENLGLRRRELLRGACDRSSIPASPRFFRGSRGQVL